MKAIVCPQCGGLINKVSKGDSIVECSYCGAKVWLQQGQKAEASKEPPEQNERVPLEDYKPFDDEPVYSATEYEGTPWDQQSPNEQLTKIIGLGIGAFILVLMFLFFGLVSKSKKPPPETFTPVVAPRYSPYPTVVQPPPPVLTNDDALVLPAPVLPKGYRIKEFTTITVYVSIDEEGKVYQAESYDQAPEALKRAGEQAAEKAKFRKGRLTSGTLVYNFGKR